MAESAVQTVELATLRPSARGPEVPLISVVTPSYNQGRFIERCIESVLAQDYVNFEHIVYDNCSTDETLDVLRRYPHIDWISEPDRGQSDALNKALRRARGEIIAWINADDYYLPGAFEVASRELRRDSGAMVILGRVHLFDTAGRVLKTTQPRFRGHEYLIDVWSHDHGLSQPGMFFRREALDRVGPLDTHLHFAMDYDLWLRLTEHYPIRIVNDVLAGFVVHAESKTGGSRFGSGFRHELEQVSRRYWGSPLTRRYWRLTRACNRHTAEQLTHAILHSHKHDRAFKWSLVGELLRRRPLAACNRYVLASVAERIVGMPRATGGKAVENGRVTVVIPTYNRAELLERAIRSVLQQSTRSRCDIVVVDDGSTDRTPTVAREFGDEIRYVRQPNAGVSAARNAGLRALHNEFVAFLDSDDQWAPDKIERQLAAMEQHREAVFVATHGQRRSADDEQWSFDLPPITFGQPIDLAPHLFERLFLLTSAVMVRTRYLGAAGLFDRGLTHGEDYLMWLRLACQGPAIVLDEPLTTCDWRAPLSLAADADRVRQARIRVRYMMRRELRQRPGCRGIWRRGLARVLAEERDRAFREKRYATAARYAFRSLMVSPLGRMRWEWWRLVHGLARSVFA